MSVSASAVMLVRDSCGDAAVCCMCGREVPPRRELRRTGPAQRAPPHAAGMLICSGHSYTIDYSIVSYSIPPTLGSRDEEMVSGRGWSRLLGLERWNKTTILVETVRSFTARAVAGQESRAAQEAASQAAPPPPPPAATRTLIGHNSRIMLL